MNIARKEELEGLLSEHLIAGETEEARTERREDDDPSLISEARRLGASEKTIREAVADGTLEEIVYVLYSRSPEKRRRS